MAESKYLDQGGVSYLWDKVKQYLDDRFGTGKYLNRSTRNEALEIGTMGTLMVGPTNGVYSLLFVNNTTNEGNGKQTRIIDTSFRLNNTSLEFLESGTIGLCENQTYGLFVHKSVPNMLYFTAKVKENVRVIAIKPTARTSTTFQIKNVLVQNAKWYYAKDFGLQEGDFAIFIIFPATAS